jgi:hypothetical protein
MRNASIIRSLAASLAVCVLMGLAPRALAEAVSRNEAVAVTRLWLQMEVDGPHSRLDDAGRIQWRERLAHPRVFYLLAGDVLQDKVATGDKVLAYIVAYEPGGFAVVTGDDRLDPFPVFDAYSPFRGDRVPENFLRKYLARNIPARWAYLRTRLEAGEVEVHPNWTSLRQMLRTPDAPDRDQSPSPLGGDTYIWWETALWGQRWPYNTLVVAENGGNDCPTGCTATAMAIQMRFFSWPPVGNSSHGYDDEWGDIQYHHGASFGSTTYEWVDMPAENITEENPDVAKLMYHCGVAVEMDYELAASGAWPSAVAMNNYFRYWGTTEIWSGTPSDHVEAMSESILAGLPVVLSTTDHTVLACGYRDTSPDDRWYLNVGWYGSGNGWYDLHDIPGDDDHLIDMSCPHSSPNNYVFVDCDALLFENGTHQHPYNTVSEGNAAVPAGGRLCIKGGSYTGAGNVPVTFSTPMRVTSYKGTARIGGS